MKEHRARAPADDAPRLLHGEMLQAVLHLPVKTACEKLFSVLRSMFLRFQLLQNLAYTAAEPSRCKHLMLTQRPARALPMLPPCMCSPSTTVLLPQARIRRRRPRCWSTSPSSSCRSTSRSATTGRRAGDGCCLFVESGQPPLHSIEYVVRALCSVREKAHLRAGTER